MYILYNLSAGQDSPSSGKTIGIFRNQRVWKGKTFNDNAILLGVRLESEPLRNTKIKHRKMKHWEIILFECVKVVRTIFHFEKKTITKYHYY